MLRLHLLQLPLEHAVVPVERRTRRLACLGLVLRLLELPLDLRQLVLQRAPRVLLLAKLALQPLDLVQERLVAVLVALRDALLRLVLCAELRLERGRVGVRRCRAILPRRDGYALAAVTAI